ncbi:hypothetical protein Scep_005879 [Stephania cephalantha]|uniref:Uncharacterized protein n=1 Tax=Stephania cephalantha TaxID=152367 RepID=A0AAP0KW61_9MAGN
MSHFISSNDHDIREVEVVEEEEEEEVVVESIAIMGHQQIRFGDDRSSLMDEFERLSFEIHLNQALRLGRSSSEPNVPRTLAMPMAPVPLKMFSESQRQRRKRGSGCRGLPKVLKKLLKLPITFGRSFKGIRSTANADHHHQCHTNPKDPMYWKTFSRSLRL